MYLGIGLDYHLDFPQKQVLGGFLRYKSCTFRPIFYGDYAALDHRNVISFGIVNAVFFFAIMFLVLSMKAQTSQDGYPVRLFPYSCDSP